jgi:hypothetical protein
VIDPAILQPGDALLYRPSSLAGILIGLFTGPLSHIEVYIGNGESIGARQEGVNLWLLRNDKYLKYVRRPKQALNVAAGMTWFNAEAKGDQYDFKGLFEFKFPKKGKMPSNPAREFCSALADMFYTKSGLDVFNTAIRPDKISPWNFFETGSMATIYPPT